MGLNILTLITDNYEEGFIFGFGCSSSNELLGK